MSERQSSTLECFAGFAWAVPKAFAGPLGQFRFEQGDVLHRDAAAYTDPEAGCRGTAIQVLRPPRSARATASGEGEGGDRREIQWQSGVELEVHDLEGGRVRRISTTQGRLWTLLWKGGRLEALEIDRAEPPPPPRDARALGAKLDFFADALDHGRRKKGIQGSRFLWVVDLASDTSLAKAAAIEEALRRLGRVRLTEARPEDAALEDADAFAPQLVVREARLSGVPEADVEAALKAALYQGGGQRESGEQSEGEQAEAERAGAAAVVGSEGEMPAATARRDRFSAARHGLLRPLGAGAEAS